MKKIPTIVALAALLAGAACAKTTTTKGGSTNDGGLPIAGASQAPARVVAVVLGETDSMHMFIDMSSTTGAAGKVTFLVTNQGKVTHEFVVLKTDTPAANFQITTFEGESDRINEDKDGVNVGETGDMKPGTTKPLAITMAPGHYAVVCNEAGHYRMGMHQDFTVVPAAGTIAVALGKTDPMHMFINLSSSSAPAGKVTFIVENKDTIKHEFVVLKTDTPAANFVLTTFEGESDRIDEDKDGTNVGETGDMAPGETKTLVITLQPGHYAVLCNLPGHYRMGMHQDFTVT